MATQGIINPLDVTSEVIYPIDVAVRIQFMAEAPLLLGLPRRPIGADKFNTGTNKVRSRSLTLGAAVADGTTTSITLVDASGLQQGDVLELISGERVEVTADPNTSTNVITVRRAAEGTTGAAQSNSTAVRLLYNSRTGNEVDQTGSRTAPSFITQYVQTFQYPVQVGGKTNAMNAIQLAMGGGSNLYESERLRRLVEMLREGEAAVLEGKGEYNVGAKRSKMKGIKAIITEGASGNVVTSPTNAGSYTPNDLHRDVFQPIIDAGGRPDTLLVSSGAMPAFTKWGWAKILQGPSEAAMGVNAQYYNVPLLGYPIAVIPDLTLRGVTFVGLSLTDGMGESRVRIRHIRQESWNPRGNRGDAIEGEWLADVSVEVDDPSHHTWTQGITAFATP